MNAPQFKTSLPSIGTPFQGGFFAGIFCIGSTNYSLVVAPKLQGSPAIATPWIDNYRGAPGAKSWNDGMANTLAMAEAGSDLAKWMRDLRIEGFDDWYLPSQDELEILYRAFKPTIDTNSQYGRSGINLSAIPPTYPYTESLPTQTLMEAFKQGGAEAFELDAYWSSTQHAAYSLSAWYQYFDDGSQYYDYESAELRARAVRRVAIQ